MAHSRWREQDAMRVSAMPLVVQAWYQILAGPEEPQLKAATLRVAKRYVPWIDIGFFANSAFMALMVQFLRVEGYQRKAVRLLTAITDKGMGPLDKLDLIRRLALLQVCRQCRPTRDSPFAVSVCRWVNTLGKGVLDGLQAVMVAAVDSPQQQQQRVAVAQEMLDACVGLMLSCIKTLDRTAAVEVLDFASRCVGHLKAVGVAGARPADRLWLQELLAAVSHAMTFDVE